jgi:hypothetical protein
MKRSILAVICLALTAYSLVAQDKPDALKLYRNGRDLESAGRVEDAKTAYTQAIEVCKQELTENPNPIRFMAGRSFAPRATRKRLRFAPRR